MTYYPRAVPPYLSKTSVPSISVTWSGLLMVAGVSLWMIKPVGDIRLVALGYFLVLLSSIVTGLSSRFWLDRRLFLYWVIAMFVCTLGVFIGVLRDNPGVESELVFFVLLPLIWLVVAWGVDLKVLQHVVNSMPIVGFLIGLYGSLYWLDSIGTVSISWVYLLDVGQGLGASEYGYELRFYPISTLIYLLPFLISSLIVKGVYSWRISRWFSYAAVLVCLLLMLVSGRRGVMVSLTLSLLVGALLMVPSSKSRHILKRFFTVAGVLGIVVAAQASITGFSVFGMVQSLISEELVEGERLQSGQDLITSWSHSPLFGNGLGHVIEGALRSEDRPWNFELQYHLLLNALGVIGLFGLAAATLGLLAAASRFAWLSLPGTSLIVPMIVGTLSVLIANGTNPYLHTPGHYWMFFLLPIGVNALKRELTPTASTCRAKSFVSVWE